MRGGGTESAREREMGRILGPPCACQAETPHHGWMGCDVAVPVAPFFPRFSATAITTTLSRATYTSPFFFVQLLNGPTGGVPAPPTN